MAHISHMSLMRDLLKDLTPQQTNRAVHILQRILQQNIPERTKENRDFFNQKLKAFCIKEYATEGLENQATIPQTFAIEENTAAIILKKVIHIDESLYPDVADTKLTIVYRKILAANILLKRTHEPSLNFYFFLDNEVLTLWKKSFPDSKTHPEALIINKAERRVTLRWNMVPSVTEEISWINDTIYEQYRMKPEDAAVWLTTGGTQLFHKLLVEALPEDVHHAKIVSLIESYSDHMKKFTFLQERMELAQDLRLQTHICQMILYSGSKLDFSKNKKSKIPLIQHEMARPPLEAAHTTIIRETPTPNQPPQSSHLLDLIIPFFEQNSRITDEIFSFLYPLALRRVVRTDQFLTTFAAHQIGVTVALPSLINRDIDKIFFDVANHKIPPATVQIARKSLDSVSNFLDKKGDESEQAYLSRSISLFLQEMHQEMTTSLAHFNMLENSARTFQESSVFDSLQEFSKVMATRPTKITHSHTKEAIRLQNLLKEYREFLLLQIQNKQLYYLIAYSHIDTITNDLTQLINRLESFILFPGKRKAVLIDIQLHKEGKLPLLSFTQKKEAFFNFRKITRKGLRELDMHLDLLKNSNKKLVNYLITVQLTTKIYQQQTKHYCRPDIMTLLMPNKHQEFDMEWIEYYRTTLWQSAAVRTDSRRQYQERSGVILPFKKEPVIA